MEAKLDNILDNMMQNDKTVGALLTDNQGLCYGSRINDYFPIIFVTKNNIVNFQLAVKLPLMRQA